MKPATSIDIEAVRGSNQTLLAKAAQAKRLHTTRLRADTTVAPADVGLPDRLGLLAKAV